MGGRSGGIYGGIQVKGGGASKDLGPVLGIPMKGIIIFGVHIAVPLFGKPTFLCHCTNKISPSTPKIEHVHQCIGFFWGIFNI